MTKNNLKVLRDFIEEKNWGVHDCSFGPDSEPGWEISKYSPAGEDFSFAVCHNNDVSLAIQEIKDYANSFDIDEHIEMWIEARQNGVSGVPSTSELCEDAKDIQEMLEELAGDVLTWEANQPKQLDNIIKSCEEISKSQNQDKTEKGSIDREER